MAKITTRISETVMYLQNRKILVYPTDTVYGIGCSIRFDDSVRKIFEIKERKDNPLSVAFASLEQIKKYTEASDEQISFMDQKLHEKGGYYTFLVNKKKEWINDLITCGSEKVGVRVIRHPDIEKIVASAGPIITTSANISGKSAVSKFQHLDQRIMEKADLILKGECYSGKPSTVIDLADYSILRE